LALFSVDGGAAAVDAVLPELLEGQHPHLRHVDALLALYAEFISSVKNLDFPTVFVP